MKLTTQNFILPVTLIYCIVLCFSGCSADPKLSGDETLTLGDRDRILAEALDWNNLQLRGPENEELIYEVNQETPYTGWVVRRWTKQFFENGGFNFEVAGPGEEWEYEEIFQVRKGEAEGVFTRWYKNGQKYSEGTYKGGYPEGMWTHWYENGQKESEGEYKRNQKEYSEKWRISHRWLHAFTFTHGMWTEWYKNGQQKSEGTYKNGEREGKWTFWYENGQKREKGTYKNGEREGKWTFWYENGQKREEGTYKNGEREGMWREWTEDGEQTEKWFGGAHVAITDVLERWREGYETESIETYMSAYWPQGFRYVSDMGTDGDKTDDHEFNDIRDERDAAIRVFNQFQDIEIELSVPPEIFINANRNRAEVRNHYRIQGFVADGELLEGGFTGWFAEGDNFFIFELRDGEWRITEWHDEAFSPQEIRIANNLNRGFEDHLHQLISWASLK